MLPAATVGLFRQQCRHPPTAAAARGLIASATRPNLLWMRQEEEMRMLEEERRQQEEQGREQEGSLLALPYPGAEKEATEKGHGEGADADTKDAGVGLRALQRCTGCSSWRHGTTLLYRCTR